MVKAPEKAKKINNLVDTLNPSSYTPAVKKQYFINQTSGVILPVALTLLVQASVSMSTVAIPVIMAVAAGELNVPPSYVGIFMSLVYLGATIVAPVSGYFTSTGNK